MTLRSGNAQFLPVDFHRLQMVIFMLLLLGAVSHLTNKHCYTCNTLRRFNRGSEVNCYCGIERAFLIRVGCDIGTASDNAVST
jgi:hypothetical protein